MILIGDVHVQFMRYLELLLAKKPSRSIQLGDFGIGYGHNKGLTKAVSVIPGIHRFIRGNHDRPVSCHDHPLCLPDVGSEGSTFWVAGGATPSFAPKDWGDAEQLSYIELQRAIGLYQKAKPRLMLSHVAPVFAGEYAYGRSLEKSMTEIAFEQMWELHKPEKWVFGHYHKSRTFTFKGTTFIALEELECVEVSDEYLS